MVLNVENGRQPQYVYYGTKLSSYDLQHLQMPTNGRMDAYPVYGLNTPAEAALAMKHADGNMSTAVYVTDCRQQGDITRITMKDPVYPTTVVLYYQVRNDEDMIETWAEIQNGESKPVTLTQFASIFNPPGISHGSAVSAQSENVIEVEHLVKAFGSFHAVDDISFTVRRGEIFGFLGANGAGKTTAMHMLTGLNQPTSGTGRVAGYDIRTQHEQIKRHIGYMSQRFSLYEDLTVAENIRLFGGIYGMERGEIAKKTERVLEELDFSAHRDDLVKSLPLGWKQKLAFSVSIFHEPDIVFLDEPTGGVDPATRRQFWQLIYAAAERGITVFVTTHYMDEAEYCDRISIMVDGKIKAMGTPAALKEQFAQPDMDHVFTYLARQATRSSD
jgi:ABC-type multidrug transport system ATPase subunit